MRPLTNLTVIPGLFTNTSARGSLNRWRDGDKVRFHRGAPEKIGGWEKADSDQFIGQCRALFDWRSLGDLNYIGLGTHQRLYVFNSGTFSNITPYDATGTLGTDPFAVVISSTTVTVTHTAHGRIQGGYVNFSGATAGGGITIDGEYVIDSITDSNIYVITHSTAATSTDSTTGGGSVAYSYELPSGKESTVSGFGWGSAAWGDSTWGTARTTSTFLEEARVWSLDKWGEDLIASPRDGSIWVWDTSGGVSIRAILTSANSPTKNKFVMVSPENQHMIAFGAETGGTQDPLLIRWSSSEDYTSWTASTTNSAGSKRLTTGDEIISGIKGSREILIFTDSHIWSMVFIGPPFVFSFDNKGKNGGIRGPNAAKEHDGIIYWMSEKNFYYYDGRANVLACDVWNTVFDNINITQKIKTYCGANTQFSEIWWFYCSASSGEVDRYVIYSTIEKTWSFGTLNRTAFVGDSALQDTPFATGNDAFLYNHETGVDDDGSALASSLSSYDIEIGEGDQMAHVSLFVPDFDVLVGSINLQLKGRRYSQSSSEIEGEIINITPSKEFINPRIKARQISMNFTTAAVGDDWRMGTMRIGARPHGKK